MDFALGVISSLAASLIVFLVAKYGRIVRLEEARETWRLGRQAKSAGLTGFYGSRADYSRFRDGNSLADYLRRATTRIDMFVLWFNQSGELDNIASAIASLAVERPNLMVTIALIDPDNPHIEGLAEYLGQDPDRVRTQVRRSLEELDSAARSQPNRKRLFTLKTYTTLPFASIIITDYGLSTGRAQVDIKPYQTAISGSFSLEVAAPSQVFERSTSAWLRMIENAEEYRPPSNGEDE